MKKHIVSSVVAVAVLLSAVSSPAQVYNTAQKLKSGAARLCVAPLLLVSHGNIDPGLYGLGGVGVTRNMDLYFSARIADDHRSNFGIGLQWALVRGSPALSFTTGGHVGPEIGIDGTLAITFPVAKSAVLYGGVDVDIDFLHNDITIPAWIFFGPRVQIRRNTALFMEVDIGITNITPSILGLGFSFYL